MIKKSAHCVYIWEYFVKKDKLESFLQYYTSDGKWVELFSKSQGFIKTELVRDIKNRLRFITIDYWVSMEDRDLFRKNFSVQFKEMDKICAAFSEEERFIGDFKL